MSPVIDIAWAAEKLEETRIEPAVSKVAKVLFIIGSASVKVFVYCINYSHKPNLPSTPISAKTKIFITSLLKAPVL
ncbi:hypothetical protein D5R40_32525 [Okeania hirsuta]|uniref:Uncharacterized protein n=1 Tax=Okeania hirsuta TaxID=1458930 RepID=A0A3N6PTT6_9CYAN|nr:hypothetical protein D5R40_32525 [Okeania hirsuta]